MLSVLRICLICLSITTLTACKTPQEKADGYYQSGLTLMKAGDVGRAAIEFLNVFQHDGFHKDARRKLADIRLEQGNVSAAYSQYLRLIEQYPDTAEVRLILAKVAIDGNNWDEARRHGEAAISLVPDDPVAVALAVAFDYRDATTARDTPGLNAAAARALALLDANPADVISRRVVIDDLLRSDTPINALPEIDRALERNPESYTYNTLRLRLLMQVQDEAAVGTQLQNMVALYPEDEDLIQSLIGWYLSQGDTMGAATYLRSLAGAVTDSPEGHMAVVQMLQATQGSRAAKAELDHLAVANDGTPNADIYRALSALISFETGERDTSIAAIQEIVSTAEPSEQTRQIRNILARMLVGVNNLVGAQTEVETILAQDQSNADALKLRAAWSIEDDRANDAILDLRRALGQKPRDAEILTLMAQAHQREGNLILSGERLALAVEVTGTAPDEALRYANFLKNQGRTAAANSVLWDARSANPNNVEVMIALARALLSNGAWVEAQGIANNLRAIQAPEAQKAATSLQAALLLGQNRIADSLTFLQNEIDQGNADTNTVAQVVKIHMQSGNTDRARIYLDQALTENADDSSLQLLDATLYAVAGDFTASENGFRKLVAEFPQSEVAVLRLYYLLLSTNRPDEASVAIDAALVAQPNSLNLRWIRAGELESQGNIDGAIALYEEMYAFDSNAVTIANNLASLIATHRDDPESIARAATIAKRLRELDVPPFQDTYGWIAYRQANFEEARSYLEPAAAALSEDPLVQYHLGMTYAALADTEKARAQLTRAIELAGDSDLPQFDVARAKLRGLDE